MVKLENVTKQFAATLAVDNLSLDISPGEVFAFLGPNGAGKTTTIKMMTGLLRPTKGRIEICGYDIQEAPIEAKRCLSYVPDQPFIYDKLTGREFLEFVGQMYGIPEEKRRSDMAALVERFEISDFADTLSETYSHGMRQRVVIAAALLHNPKALIVDEPMVGLDPRSARILKNVLREIADAGSVVFISTHTLAVAEEIADRIGIIHHGRLAALGTISEIRSGHNSESGLEDLFLQLTDDADGETNFRNGTDKPGLSAWSDEYKRE
ncbi:MAG TPA: ABC transporter ATP-binding protein [Candidatus Brocadiia bacterium]|nr:ABC transporter ATP-binding protein [Candidatus Brocadiia bacterium]